MNCAARSLLFFFIRLHFFCTCDKINRNNRKHGSQTMGKLIMKTALITLSVTFVLAISVFGIVSFSAPGAMMSFSASLGMESVSGDYAFAEYERSGNLSCLVRAAETAEKANALSSADERFTLLLKDEKFPAYCAEKDGEAAAPVSYKQYVYGLAAGVIYSLGVWLC